MPSPSFRIYLRVIRAKPGFCLSIAAVAAISFRNVLVEGVIGALIPLLIGLAIIVAAFPWWRRRAIKKPEAYTWGQPDLLADDPPMHPQDPPSNVHRLH